MIASALLLLLEMRAWLICLLAARDAALCLWRREMARALATAC